MKKLENKVALITGGGSGIGLASAKLFQEQGAKVVITGRNQEKLEKAKEEIGGEVLTIQADISNLKDLDRLFNEVNEKLGKIDVLFANAGIIQFAPIEETTEEFFDQISDINWKGTYFTLQKSLPFLNDGASVVLTTSVSNKIGMAGTSVYAATKAALRSLARTASAELLDRKIRVNAISPGPVATPIYDTLGLSKEESEEMQEGITQQVPMKRFGEADEIARTALFLASEDSAYILGVELVADGGLAQL